MTDALIRSPAPLRDALYALSLAQPTPDAELLDEFVRRYPEHAAALTAFAIDLAVAAAEDTDESVEPATSATSPTVARAMSRFHNRLHAVRRETAARGDALASAVPNPFASLDRAALRGLGERLGVSTVFMMKLRDRQIKPDTMTDGFRRLVADKVRVPVDVIAGHFAGRPEMLTGAHFSAEQKPEVGAQQTFEEAVRSSGLTPEQQNRLLSL